MVDLLFVKALNMTNDVAAWCVHCRNQENNFSHLNFRREVTSQDGLITS